MAADDGTRKSKCRSLLTTSFRTSPFRRQHLSAAGKNSRSCVLNDMLGNRVSIRDRVQDQPRWWRQQVGRVGRTDVRRNTRKLESTKLLDFLEPKKQKRGTDAVVVAPFYFSSRSESIALSSLSECRATTKSVCWVLDELPRLETSAPSESGRTTFLTRRRQAWLPIPAMPPMPRPPRPARATRCGVSIQIEIWLLINESHEK